MAFTLHVDIVSAESEIYSGRAERVFAPGVMGELCVLPHHAPLMTHLKAGLVRVAITDEKEDFFFISSGILEVQPHVVTVLADTVIRSQQLDKEAALAAKNRVEHRLSETLTQEQYSRLKNELATQTALLRAIEQIRERRR